MPPDPSTVVSIFNINHYVKIWCPLTEKKSEYATDMKTFFKGSFTSFLGLTSLYLVNIQPNSKFHPPYQNFLDPFLSCEYEMEFFLEHPPLKFAGCAPVDGCH